MKKEDKKQVVESLKNELVDATSVILVNHTGMNMGAQNELKKRLKAVDARMVVVKNTLIERAGKDAGLPEETLTDTVLSGQSALVIAKGDPVAPVQVVGKFGKEFDLPKFKIGIVEGSFRDAAELAKIATLPSKDVLYSQVLGSLLASQYGLVSVLENNAQMLIYVLGSKAGTL